MLKEKRSLSFRIKNQKPQQQQHQDDNYMLHIIKFIMEKIRNNNNRGF